MARLTGTDLQAAAKVYGIAVPKEQETPVLAGAAWLKDCVALLRRAGLGR